MLFKFVTILAAVATAVSASAVDLEARQVGGLATCNIVTTPSSTPNGGSLSEEFILVFNREFSADLPPGNSIVTGSTSFSGPSGGRYTVQKTTGGTAITAAQTRAIMQAWAGQTFAGAGQVGVSSWLVNSVSCPKYNDFTCERLEAKTTSLSLSKIWPDHCASLIAGRGRSVKPRVKGIAFSWNRITGSDYCPSSEVPRARGTLVYVDHHATELQLEIPTAQMTSDSLNRW
ncbi:hypothetical protein DFP72DRAFT_850355 [Ephemerocybe angulata]|uniref:Uncharacterized protein n=1 Tax=Ephemerocybe angulata TaxID=980116 RepID=A0A8H6HSB0_9AGAR|nr:hypothetical protein DFP72DRAFT_850355 [Tulosesus angulatus]